jgi:hypothetical protein
MEIHSKSARRIHPARRTDSIWDIEREVRESWGFGLSTGRDRSDAIERLPCEF